MVAVVGGAGSLLTGRGAPFLRTSKSWFWHLPHLFPLSSASMLRDSFLSSSSFKFNKNMAPTGPSAVLDAPPLVGALATTVTTTVGALSSVLKPLTDMRAGPLVRWGGRRSSASYSLAGPRSRSTGFIGVLAVSGCHFAACAWRLRLRLRLRFEIRDSRLAIGDSSFELGSRAETLR